jgi:hypothetical protein
MSNSRGRPFEPGNKLGRGRPKGSRNREKSVAQNLLEEHSPHIIRKTLALALAGNLPALKLAMERIMPARRDGHVPIELPRIRTAKEVGLAAEKVTQAIGRGDLTPAEGETMMRILEMRARVIETGLLEDRLEVLEKAVASDTARQP